MTKVYSSRAAIARPGSRVWIWSPFTGDTGLGTSGPTLPDGWTWQYPAIYARTDATFWQFAWEITVPSNASADTYTIDAGDQEVDIIVDTTASSRTKTVYANSASMSTVQSWLTNDGTIGTIEFAPRIYRIEEPITIPDGVTFTSPGGARFVRYRDGTTYNRAFDPAGEFTLENCTLEFAGSEQLDNWWIFTLSTRDSSATAKPITVRGCTILSGCLGKATEANMLIERCVFDRGLNLNACRNSVWLLNEFRGRTADSYHHLAFGEGAAGALLATNTWVGTSRGIVIGGESEGIVGLDLQFRNIRRGSGNAGECILFEDGYSGIPTTSDRGCRYCLFNHVTITDCEGPGIGIAGSGMHDLIFYQVDMECDKHAILINEDGGEGGAIGAVEFNTMEISGAGRITINGSVSPRKWVNVIATRERPARHGGDASAVAANYSVWHGQGLFTLNADATSGTDTFSGCAEVTANGVTTVSSVTHGSLSTTDDTTTTILTVPLRDGYAATIVASVFGIGADGNSGTLKIVVRAKRASSTVTMQNTTNVTTDDSPPGSWALTATNSGTNVVVQVTGEEANVIHWRVEEFSISEASVPSS